MIKRYQVFISSTYADLRDERSKVIQTIMELDCIPAGMEIFPAIDEEQFNFIKSVIDDCDYYLLIIGGRYGSISEDGISYTEKEYDYAITKGIKVLAFIHENPEAIPFGKSEKNEILRKKLQVFKDKVSTNRLIKFWNKTEELPGLVALSLSKTIKTHHAIGWIRANSITNPELLQELNEERKKNNFLTEKLGTVEKSRDEYQNDLATFEDEYTIAGYVDEYKSKKKWKITLKWKDIFALLSPYLLNPPSDTSAQATVSKIFFEKSSDYYSTVYKPHIDEEIFNTLKIHLQALDLIEVKYTETTSGSMNLFWFLTSDGKKKMTELRSVKKKQ